MKSLSSDNKRTGGKKTTTNSGSHVRISSYSDTNGTVLTRHLKRRWELSGLCNHSEESRDEVCQKTWHNLKLLDKLKKPHNVTPRGGEKFLIKNYISFCKIKTSNTTSLSYTVYCKCNAFSSLKNLCLWFSTSTFLFNICHRQNTSGRFRSDANSHDKTTLVKKVISVPS